MVMIMKKEEKNINIKYTFKDSLKELVPYVAIILVVVLIRTFLFTHIDYITRITFNQ